MNKNKRLNETYYDMFSYEFINMNAKRRRTLIEQLTNGANCIANGVLSNGTVKDGVKLISYGGFILLICKGVPYVMGSVTDFVRMLKEEKRKDRMLEGGMKDVEHD